MYTKEKAQYDKNFTDNNKERIKDRKGKLCICDCGNNYTHIHKSRHLKTQFHQNWIQINQTNTK